MNITAEFKTQVIKSLKDLRTRFGGSDSAFAKQRSINPSVWSRLKNGETEGLLKDTQWINLGRELNIQIGKKPWNLVRTEVYEAIESDILFCQKHSKGMILVDEPEIGKTEAGKHLSKTLKNCFYIDCSQSKNKILFVRAFAKVLGLETIGRVAEIKENIKYYLRMLENPMVILDEAGDLEYGAILELKEFWNATEDVCGWYLMGADGLRRKWESGINTRKVGYRELFSRYSSKYISIVPADRNERLSFYSKMVTDVLKANSTGLNNLPALVKKCLASDSDGQIGGLRRAKTVLKLEQD